jgi:hypothetical protein
VCYPPNFDCVGHLLSHFYRFQMDAKLVHVYLLNVTNLVLYADLIRVSHFKWILKDKDNLATTGTIKCLQCNWSI